MSPLETSVVEQDPHSALIFALAAERLAAYYEHHTWLTIAQGSTLAADWLAAAQTPLGIERPTGAANCRFTITRGWAAHFLRNDRSA